LSVLEVAVACADFELRLMGFWFKRTGYRWAVRWFMTLLGDTFFSGGRGRLNAWASTCLDSSSVAKLDTYEDESDDLDEALEQLRSGNRARCSSSI